MLILLKYKLYDGIVKKLKRKGLKVSNFKGTNYILQMCKWIFRVGS
jgi:hypothetical protein